MKRSSAGIVLAVTVLLSPEAVYSQRRAPVVYLLHDAKQHQWCAYADSAAWNAAVEEIGATAVGSLSYSGDRLEEIDLTETDESGDWTVYDRYFLDSAGSIVRLSRTINVLPGDRSVLQELSVEQGRMTVHAVTEKTLSTGETSSSPRRVWLPDLPVIHSTRSFPFAWLIEHQGVRVRGRTCNPG